MGATRRFPAGRGVTQPEKDDMAAPALTPRLHGIRDEAPKAVRAFVAAGLPRAGRGFGIGATLGTLVGASAGLMAGIGAIPIPGVGPVVAAGWLVATLTGAGAGAAAGAAAGRLLGSLAGAGEAGARVHAGGVRRGDAAGPARVECAEAMRFGSAPAAGGGHVDAAERGAEHRGEDWNRSGLVALARTAPQSQAERKRRVRVYGARPVDDTAPHRGAETKQQGARPGAVAAPRQGIAAAAYKASHSQAWSENRIRVYVGRAVDAAAPRHGIEPAADTAFAVQGERERRIRVHDARPGVGAPARRGAEAAADTGFGGRAEREHRIRVYVGRPADDAAPRPGAGAAVDGDVAPGGRAEHRPGEAGRDAPQAPRGTTEDARRPAAAPPDAAGDPRDPRPGETCPFEGAAQANLRVAQALFRLADPTPIMEAQQRFVRAYTDTLLRNSAALARAASRAPDEALRPLGERRSPGAAE